MTDSLPVRLYRADQVRQLDRLAIETMGIAGFELMMRAGRSAFRHLLRRWPGIGSLTLFCGGGNNGGDGYVIAGLAKKRGMNVQLYWLSAPETLKGEAAQARDWAASLGVAFQPWRSGCPIDGDVLVDALLGTGLNSRVRGLYGEVIGAINASGRPVVAVDMPSGLSSDTGMPLGCAVQAELTVTFIGLKQGLLTGVGPDYVGTLVFDDLGVTPEVYGAVPPACRRVDWRQVAGLIAPRPPCAHKGQFGRVLIVGGDEGMGGAAIMAAEAAARTGAGLISVATHRTHAPAVLVRCPEVMARGVRTRHDLWPMLGRADVVVIGPGLGTGAWSQQMLQAVLESGKPLVLDADALNLIAAQGLAELVRAREHVMTPHPGEAARLLGSSVADIQADRFAAVAKLQQAYGGAILLKGAGTLISGGEADPLPTLASVGNPGMATGGMGDVLSGMVGALLAQSYSARQAAELAACLHGEAARVAAWSKGYVSLLPTDVVAALPSLLKDRDPMSSFEKQQGNLHA